MKNLLKMGISQETINEMIDESGIYVVEELDEEYSNTYRILNTLRQLKIDNEIINVLLVNYHRLFLMDYNKFISKLRYADLREVADRINDDASAVESIFLED